MLNISRFITVTETEILRQRHVNLYDLIFRYIRTMDCLQLSAIIAFIDWELPIILNNNVKTQISDFGHI